MSAAPPLIRPKYITDGSRLLEVYDAWGDSLQCLDSIEDTIVMVKTENIGGKKEDGKSWWAVTPALDEPDPHPSVCPTCGGEWTTSTVGS
jgi:hypothetical protein